MSMGTNRFRTFLGMAVVASALTASSACASPNGRVYVRVGPPAPLYETRIVAPGPGYVWVSGYHTWNGSAYVWAPGRWDRPPRARAVWVPAQWARDRHGWYL